MTSNGDSRSIQLQSSPPFAKPVESDEAQQKKRQFSKQGSLETLSFRVLELLEGLNEREAESMQVCPTNIEEKFLQIEEKLKSYSADQSQSLRTEFQNLKDSIFVKAQTKRINSSLLAELVETVQVLLRESSPKHLPVSNDASPTSPTKRVQKLIGRIEAKLNHSDFSGISDETKKELESMCHTLTDEVKKLIFKIQSVDQDRGDLIRLVSSGQEILADMMKENESLENQLTLHITSQSSNLLNSSQHSISSSGGGGDNVVFDEHQSNGQESRTRQEEALLRLWFKEKTNAEMLEQQASNLASQLSSRQKEMEQLVLEKKELLSALDQASWMEEKDKLLQMLEEEKDKVSTWNEEFEDIEQQLKSAQEKIETLETENLTFQRAADQTSWAQDRQILLDRACENQEKIQQLSEQLQKVTLENADLKKSSELMGTEIRQLKENEDETYDQHHHEWTKQQLSLKLEIAEKQNRIFELTSQVDEANVSIGDYQRKLEDAQMEVENLSQQVEEVAWSAEKDQLLQALEKEIDKRSSWEEDRVSLDQQILTLTEEVAGLRAENTTLVASLDEVSWSLEREELCEAIEEEKEKFSSWREEMEALEDENKELKRVFHESKDKDLIIRDKNEALEMFGEKIELLESKLKIQDDEIKALSGTLSDNPETWVKEKVNLLSEVAKLKLACASTKDNLKLEHSKHQSCRIRIEELEIELDRLQRELVQLKSYGLSKKTKHVSWGSSQILQESNYEMSDPHQQSMNPVPSLSIVIKHSNSRFGEGVVEDPFGSPRPVETSASGLPCDLSVRVPHQRSKSIPPTIQL